MTIRVTPDLNNTKDILEHILPILNGGERVAFICPAGQADLILTRVRVMISRTRRGMRQRNRKPKQFRLLSTVHNETHEGIRMECIVLAKEVSFNHQLGEHLEDLLGG